MKVAGKKGENPRELAEKTAEKLENIDIVEKVEVAGPGYLNFFLDREEYSKQIQETLDSEKMGVNQKDGKVLVEFFSSPNLAKAYAYRPSAQQLSRRLTSERILRFVDYNVTSENYIGDWGTKHGQVIYAFKNGDRSKNLRKALWIICTICMSVFTMKQQKKNTRKHVNGQKR